MRLKTTILSIGLLVPGLALGFELNEQLLGLANVPYKIGQAVTSEQAGALACTASGTGLLVCPIPAREPRMLSIMLAKADGGFRVTSLVSSWKCEPTSCPDVVKDTAATLSNLLGSQPEQLNGVPIWKDRERHHRDLMITTVGSDMVGIVLVESD